jgi:DDE superfamily endonuclease
LIDVCHVDEAGFSMTQPTNYTWYLKGERMHVPYEAPQGRRVNVIGGYFSHGPMAGEFLHQSFATLPRLSQSASTKNTSTKNTSTKNTSTKNTASGQGGAQPRKERKTLEQQARENGLAVEELGPIDAQRFLLFLWKLSGRPGIAPSDWKRERPLVVVLDNYSVHHSQLVNDAREALEAADIFLFYLPAYSPKLSRIEPIGNDTKQHYLRERTQAQVARLKAAVDDALTRKAASTRLRRQTSEHKPRDSTILLRRAA